MSYVSLSHYIEQSEKGKKNSTKIFFNKRRRNCLWGLSRASTVNVAWRVWRCWSVGRSVGPALVTPVGYKMSARARPNNFLLASFNLLLLLLSVWAVAAAQLARPLLDFLTQLFYSFQGFHFSLLLSIIISRDAVHLFLSFSYFILIITSTLKG